MLIRYDVKAEVEHNYIPPSLNPNALKELENLQQKTASPSINEKENVFLRPP